MSLSMKLLLKKMFPLGFTNEMGAVLKGLICGAYVYMGGHLFVEKGSIEKTLFHRKWDFEAADREASWDSSHNIGATYM